MKIIRGRLSAADVSNPALRYNSDCDCMQVTPDGGTTWNPAPDSDPRHSPVFLKPPVAGSSKQCDAAANMTKWLHDFIDQCLFDFGIVGSVTTIINSLLIELELLGPFAELLAVVSEVAETISTVGEVGLTAAFTSTEYDLIKCIFYCHNDSSGRMSADSLATVELDMTAQLNTTAALVTNAILSLQGEIGVSNAGAIGGETGDCTACACDHCREVDLTVTDGSEVGVVILGGTWTEGVGWRGNNYGGSDVSDLFGYWAFPAVTHVLQLDVEYFKQNGAGGDNITHFNYLYPTATGYNTVGIYQDATNTVQDPLIVRSYTPLENLAGLGWDINSGDAAGPVQMQRLRIRYSGDQLFGGDNC